MEESVDRLSELPDSLIHLILCFLPMRDVVSTTILSKRWNDVWTTIPCLNFSDEFGGELVNRANRDRNFVNQVLMFWKGTKILSFNIVMHDLSDSDLSIADDFDSWVRFAVEYKVEDLSIDLRYDHDVLDWIDFRYDHDVDGSVTEYVFSVPPCLNSCSSLRKLLVRGCKLRVQGSPAWNQLTSLTLDGFCISGSLAAQILSGTPRLEVFVLSFMESFEDLDIQSTSLKKLKINKNFNVFDYSNSHAFLRICCPNLEILEISGNLYAEYFLTNVSSLTDAIFGFCDKMYDYVGGIELLGERFGKILPTIEHVENLTLSSACCIAGLIAALDNCLLSPFPNVKFIEVKFCDTHTRSSDVVKVLGVFPNLEMLVIENSHKLPWYNIKNLLYVEVNLPNPFLLLKTIHITSPLHDPDIFAVIKLLLKHATVLEKLVIWVDLEMRCPEFPFKAAEVLLKNMSKSSPTAKVIIKTI